MLTKHLISSDIGPWTALFEGDFLIFLGSAYLGPQFLQNEFEFFIQKHFPNQNPNLISSETLTPQWCWKQSPPLKLHGTKFQISVWNALRLMPPNTLMTYSDVATLIGKPKAIRAVASAIAKNPIAYWIPCHRIIHKQDRFVQYRWGQTFKSKVFEFENKLLKFRPN